MLNEGITKGILEKPALAAPVSPSGGIRTVAPSRGVLPKLSRHFYDSINGIPRPSRALPRQDQRWGDFDLRDILVRRLRPIRHGE